MEKRNGFENIKLERDRGCDKLNVLSMKREAGEISVFWESTMCFMIGTFKCVNIYLLPQIWEFNVASFWQNRNLKIKEYFLHAKKTDQLCFKIFLSFRSRVGNGWRHRWNKTDYKLIIVETGSWVVYYINLA